MDVIPPPQQDCLPIECPYFLRLAAASAAILKKQAWSMPIFGKGMLPGQPGAALNHSPLNGSFTRFPGSNFVVYDRPLNIGINSEYKCNTMPRCCIKKINS
jgi:hypothetical protein